MLNYVNTTYPFCLVNFMITTYSGIYASKGQRFSSVLVTSVSLEHRRMPGI